MSKQSTQQNSFSGLFRSHLGDHLKSVDETYFQHMRHALSFTLTMLVTAVACFIHAFLPFLFKSSGSDTILRLHDRMVINRKNLSS